MPLLAMEPSVYPENLFDDAADFAGARRWWVLHTRPRAEKALARKCFGQDVPFFLPLYPKRWCSAGRWQRSYLPLFPGYLFLHGDEQHRLSALQTNLVAHVIPVAEQQQLHADLLRVHRLIDAGSSLTPEERLQPGTPVEIIAGPMAGLRGKVLSRGRHMQFFIEVQFLQRGVSVEIEPSLFQAIHS